MKQGIHPTWHQAATVTCVTCNTVWTVGSTKQEIQTEACSRCHPFYTGQKRILDTTGRVERFEERLKETKAMKKQTDAKREKKQKRVNNKPARPEAKKLG